MWFIFEALDGTQLLRNLISELGNLRLIWLALEKNLFLHLFSRNHVPHTEDRYLIYVRYLKCHKLQNLKWLMISLIIIIHLCNVRFHESNYLSSRKFPIKTKINDIFTETCRKRFLVCET